MILFNITYLSIFFKKWVEKINNNFDLIEFAKSKYKNEELVRLVNPRQCYFYMENGVFPLWNEVGFNNKIVYVFLKEPTLRLFQEWREFSNNFKG